MKRKLLSLALVPMVLALAAGTDSYYGTYGSGQLNVWAGGGSASAYAQTSAYNGSDYVTVSVSLTPSGPGCSGSPGASNDGDGYTSAEADAPPSCDATSATGAAFHTVTDLGWVEQFSTYATQP